MRVAALPTMILLVAIVLVTSCEQERQVVCRSEEGHGDYFGSEGMFETASAALTDVLSGTGAELGDYTSDETESGRVSYRYTATDFAPHTWDVWNEGEDWFVQSVDGCLDVVGPT